METMLAAVVPDDWTPDGTDRVIGSCEKFITILTGRAGESGRSSPKERGFVTILNQSVDRASGDGFVELCAKAHANRPFTARETEIRYHDGMRAAVTQQIDVDLWR